ncbi:hypothetical protein D0962_27780 [Leptolyngbyaceae cyanobacterium CCMR0082]|uniref:Uncharacterized protein n=2 Tax=Adonisia turfae TaxID=2950184 RepID=A0A6M0SDG0_9CYAN|nr:hypothetical protein [Adonisia turfae]NEZ58325.1 hypothetical protein [Adonisia turfae CCMR0081]NEZ66515.1 hypothetical protein [Adonisia turfae CCMR0082]
MGIFFDFMAQYGRRVAVGLLTIAATLGVSSTATQAQESFGNQGIRLDVDTIVEFEFLESNGSYQSTFGIINVQTGEKFPIYSEVKGSDVPQPVNKPSDYQDDAGVNNRDDFQGTPGVTVPQPLEEFRLTANTEYSFYLESSFNGQPAGILYSTTRQNAGNRQYARFDGPIGDVIDGGLLLRWEDAGELLVGAENADYDYDDFIVRIGGYLQWDQP